MNVEVPVLPVSAFESSPDRGVGATVDGRDVLVGSPSVFERRGWELSGALQARVRDVREDGNVPVVVGWDGDARSVLGAGDRPRTGWQSVVDALAADGREVIIVSGDDEASANRFRDHPGIADVFAGAPPAGKSVLGERFVREETVAMVGDGSNDAPALAAADLGIALENGTAQAIDAADVVATTDDLSTIPELFELTAATNARIRQNLGWAFLYNSIAIPVAVAGHLRPLVAAIAMASSRLLVVGNSTRSIF